ncbi:CBM_HP2_G0000850.mRNA.1.CDS.1 [Saccharomyces cerevisiae]|nr:CBM_HP2_G0000850.mRNA.1.CDS.1 [Saccharomyces cerevisiae]CAI6384856.1 CBM_HP2_G0000850.mRNA.1.CDS.1 [Saccharomyces cerevisiae]
MVGLDTVTSAFAQFGSQGCLHQANFANYNILLWYRRTGSPLIMRGVTGHLDGIRPIKNW